MRPLKALAALAALIAIVVGPPILLVMFIGNPIPADLTLTTSLSDDAVIRLASLVVWALWLQTTGCIVAETASAIRGAHLARIPGTFAGQRHLARALVALVIAGASAPTLTPHAADAVTTQTTTQPAETHANPAPPGPAPQHASEAHETRSHPEARTVTVARGDSLWKLADEHLGNGERWPEIKAANQGRTMNDDRVFRGEDTLQPGWELTIPTVAPAGTDRIVQPGDTLSQIALDELGNANRYPEIFDASRHLDQPVPLVDPNLIYPGQRLDIPGKEATRHEVTGETSEAVPTRHRPAPKAAEAVMRSPRAVEIAHADTGTHQVATHHLAAADVEEPSGLPSWVIPGLATASGTLLAGALLKLMRRRRAMQHRHRRPGYVLSDPPTATLAAEKSIAVAGGIGEALVDRLDQILRRLATTLIAEGMPLPDVAAVEVTEGVIAIHAQARCTLPPPWTDQGEGLVWTIGRETDLQLIGPDPQRLPAPWPLLVTLGHDKRDGVWLLNLEGRTIAVTGDRLASEDLLRFIAAEILCNPWSRTTRLDVIGACEELVIINSIKARAHETLADLASAGVAEAVTTIDRLADLEIPDGPSARAADDDPDPWPSRVAIVANSDVVAELDQLAELIGDHTRRTGAALILTGVDLPATWTIELEDAQTLRLPEAELSLTPVGLSQSEATDMATLLAHLDSEVDQPAADLEGAEPWMTVATESGALRETLRIDRSATTLEPASSVLPREDESYLTAGATTVSDLNAVAPKVTARVQAEVQSLDPGLDDDVAEWHDDNAQRPRLTVLGPVAVRVPGNPKVARPAFQAELLTYLTTRRHGATADELCTAFDLEGPRARNDVGILREWLGFHPVTGNLFIPNARNGPAAKRRGIPIYEAVDILSDHDLFRRLHVRGQSRGPEGLADLIAALRLVTGRPFQQLRTTGWAWMFEGDRLDQHAVCAIADVAHTVVTASLAAGDVPTAREAVDTALDAAPDEEFTRLDHAAVLAAEGHAELAARVVNDDVCNRSDDENQRSDPSGRAESVIEAKRWNAGRRVV